GAGGRVALRSVRVRLRSPVAQAHITGFLPHVAVSEMGEWHEVPRGRVPAGRRTPPWLSWLASLAPPPPFGYSPVPLPLHGGEGGGRLEDKGGDRVPFALIV